MMNHDIFISYSSKQKSIADGVCRYLEEKGFKCWMAPRDIPVGSDYGDLIDDSIKACKVMVLVFSESASTSQWVKGEVNVAFSENKPILPFRVDETDMKGSFRVMLNQMHWIDAYPDYSEKLPVLVKSICGILGRPYNPTEHDENKQRQVKKKFPIWAILLLIGVAVGASSLIFLKSNQRLLGKNYSATRQIAEKQIRNAIQDLCEAIETDEYDDIGKHYANQVERYHSIYDVTNEEIVNRYKAYDEKFGVSKKNYNIRWNTLQVWENSNAGWTVVVVMDYHIDRDKADNYRSFVLEKHYELDKDFKIVSEYDVQLSKSKY